jgi:hypothetical protein
MNHMNGWVPLEMLITMCCHPWLLFSPGIRKFGT